MKVRIWIALIAVYIVWGSTYLAMRFAVQTMPPFLMAATRFLIAGSILFFWRRAAGDYPATRWQWRSAAIVGAFLLVGGNGAVVWAEQTVPSGIAALIIGATPLFMVLIDAVRPGGQKPTSWTVIGVLVGFVGIALLIGPTEFGDRSQRLDPAGVAALLLASFLWAAGSIYSRKADMPASPLLGTGMEMLVGGTGLLVLGTLTGEWGRLDLQSISAASLWGLVYLIIFGSLVGFASYTWLLRVAPTPLVSTYAYVNPLIAIILGSLLLQEPLTGRVVIATFIIVSAVALINTSRASKPQPKPVAAIASGDD